MHAPNPTQPPKVVSETDPISPPQKMVYNSGVKFSFRAPESSGWTESEEEGYFKKWKWPFPHPQISSAGLERFCFHDMKGLFGPRMIYKAYMPL